MIAAAVKRLVYGAFGFHGPYGEGWGSDRMRLDRTLRSQPIPEDILQGDGNRERMRMSCVDLYRTSAIAHAAVSRIADYATVCQPYPITDNPNWNKTAFDFFEDWQKSADYRSRPGVDLRRMTRLAHLADYLVGESYFMPTADGRLQPIESDRIATPNAHNGDAAVSGGIRTDGTDRIVGYYVCSRGDGGAIDRDRFTFVPANGMFHVPCEWRFDMLHGVPLLHAAVSKLADYDETDEAMRNKVKNEARQFYTQKNSLPFGGGRVSAQGSGFSARRLVKTEIGMVYEGGDGIDLIESKSPNATYTIHMIEEAKAVAAAVNIPYEYLMMIFTAGSYNAQKGARLAFSDTCMARARRMVERLHQRVWDWRIALAIAQKDLPPAPTAPRWDGRSVSQWNRVEWAAPRFRDIDMAKDVSARSAAWAAGQQSLRDQRTNPYQVLTDKAEDILEADAIAVETNKKMQTGSITWQHLINAGVPGMQVPQSTQDADEDEDNDTDDTNENEEGGDNE